LEAAAATGKGEATAWFGRETVAGKR